MFIKYPLVHFVHGPTFKQVKELWVNKHKEKLQSEIKLELYLAIFTMPKPDSCSFQQRITLPITVICDNVRDPGNLGSIIRTCAASGCDRLIATKGCVDIWDPKVIRSGMGSHFRLSMINDISWETINQHIPENSKVYLADHKYSLDDKPSLNDDRKSSNFSIEGKKYLTNDSF